MQIVLETERRHHGFQIAFFFLIGIDFYVWIRVAFTDERLVGEAAVNQAARNPTNTIYDAKRMIGKK